jgi:hypothetical protein
VKVSSRGLAIPVRYLVNSSHMPLYPVSDSHLLIPDGGTCAFRCCYTGLLLFSFTYFHSVTSHNLPAPIYSPVTRTGSMGSPLHRQELCLFQQGLMMLTLCTNTPLTPYIPSRLSLLDRLIHAHSKSYSQHHNQDTATSRPSRRLRPDTINCQYFITKPL